MKHTVLTVFLAAFAAAKTIDELVEDIPTCAVTCIRDAASSVNCAISDFACSCSKQDQLTPSVVGCLSKSSCSADDQTSTYRPFDTTRGSDGHWELTHGQQRYS